MMNAVHCALSLSIRGTHPRAAAERAVKGETHTMDVVVRSAVPRVFGKVLLGIALGLTPLATAALARVIILSATLQVVFQAGVYLQIIGGCIIFAAAFALMCVGATYRQTRFVSLGMLIGLVASAATAIFWVTQLDWSNFAH